MPYFLIFLFLTACANSKQETPAAVQPPPAQEAPTNVPTALGAEWLEMWGENLDDYTGEDGYGPPFIFYTDDDLTPLYLGENQKYRAEYAAFFQEQLELYGRNSRGERIVDREKLNEFEARHPFSRL